MDFLPSSNVLTERRVSPLVTSSQLRSICTSSKLEASWTFKRKTVPVDEEKETQQDEDNVESQEASGPLKSHPYRNICPWKSKSELAKFLLENQIFNDYGILVINKPFGVGVRNQTLQQLQRNGSHNQLHLRGIQTVPYTLEDIVPTLRNLLEKPELVFVKSTEKLTSGLAVFAMDEQTGTKFTKALKTSKSYYDTLYKYHVITILPPMLHKEPGEMERIGVTVKAGVGTDVPQPIIVRGYSNNSVKRDDVKSIHTRVYPLKWVLVGAALWKSIRLK
ncbi:RNA pseudouridylate synthase domain-containing protein 4 [Orchesella cincta]|uniref:RNA pseudouridylate synthase domain-containing protein 4 n=1 Tax=Orchesella cincta TaxID=48709 RepID=A0A1D2NBR9_ORCCI|nr:RNA pseudouridylate synthase domain-containing protein 4 [Orchesella cincta]